jgi:hypothetical protein
MMPVLYFLADLLSATLAIFFASSLLTGMISSICVFILAFQNNEKTIMLITMASFSLMGGFAWTTIQRIRS